MTASKQLWGSAEVDPGSEIERVLGSLTLRIRRHRHEVWVHGGHGEGEAPRPAEWERWALAESDRLELRPSLPDRPVVVSPEQPFHIPFQGVASVYVRVPLFVNLFRVSDDGGRSALAAYPSLVLSDTWWGTYTEGEVAYWLTTRARRAAPPDIFEPHLAVCPLVLNNRATEALPIDRFAVRVSHLTLFTHDDATWTDEVYVRYEGSPQGSEIEYTGRVPADVVGAEQLAPPRDAPPRGLQALTFGRLRAISGW